MWIVLCTLIAVAVFIWPFIWQLLRENKELRETTDEDVYFRIACETTSDGLLIQDMKANILWANPAYGRIHGLPMDQIVGRNPLEFALPADQTPTPSEIAKFRYDPDDPAWTGYELVKNARADGSEFWNQINVSFHTADDGRENAILVCRNVTEQVEQEQNLRAIGAELEHEASHDGLTGVRNRSAFLSFLENALSGDDYARVGLLHIDLDKFKAINDTHGHSAGDEVLTHTATCLQTHSNRIDMVARVGGDEFVVVCPDIENLEALGKLANTFIAAIAEPFEWNNRVLQSQASIGAVLSNAETTGSEDLLTPADFALYEAKRKGRNQVALYDDAMHDRHMEFIHRSAELVEAVDTDALDYFFQPTMDLATGAITGFETLVRWEHSTDGIIPPDQFLPLAEELGLMGALDLLSMTAALKEKIRLRQAGFPHLKLAFNASPELLTHPEFINRLTWGVEAGGIDRADITIEVLETTEFGRASEKASHAAIIHDLRSAGFGVHLDDFGIGFAGLSHLATLNVSGVKVDRSLVKEIFTDPVSEKIVRKIIELSNELGLNVIAEGVEDQAIATALHDMGCRVIQGYWLSRPLPQDELVDWLSGRDPVTIARSA